MGTRVLKAQSAAGPETPNLEEKDSECCLLPWALHNQIL